MPSRQRVQQLIEYVEQGRILEAMEEFYDEEVTMQENAHPPTVGKAANVARERAFVASIATVHEARATSVLVDGDQVVIAWVFDYTDTAGRRTRLDQLARQTWRGDRIVAERFYYDSVATAAPAAA